MLKAGIGDVCIWNRGEERGAIEGTPARVRCVRVGGGGRGGAEVSRGGGGWEGRKDQEGGGRGGAQVAVPS